MSAAARSSAAFAACVALAFAVVTEAAPRRSPLTAAEAEQWLTTTSATRERDRALAEWAKDAGVDDLLWVLRLPPATLGAVEAPILDSAIRQVPPERAELRQRLLARRALVPGRVPRRNEPPLPSLDALRPWASVWRVTAILPSQGEYAGFASAVRSAVAEGLRHGRPAGARAIELDTLATGDSDPALVAEAFERARQRSDVIVGELLSTPTFSLATAAGACGMTLVSPTATDDRIGRIGPHVVQVGPGPEARAHALADVVLGGRAHVVAISGSAAGVKGAFADAFAKEAEARGGRIARREHARDVVLQVRAIRESGADVLFWDGAAKDAEALLKALASEGVSVRLCGGPALSPEGMRPQARALLEGVAWVSDDWRLPAPVRARLDSLAAAAGLRKGAFWSQGWLAGRGIAAAIDGGARSAGEVARALKADAASGDMLDAKRAGATLPVFVMTGGRAVEAPATR